METPEGCGSIHELRVIAKRAGQVWHLVSQQRKFALGGATLLMIITSAGNTAMALLLDWWVDGFPIGRQQELSRETLYAAAFRILGLISAIYVVREVINVFRRFLVESSCTAINRDMQIQLVEQAILPS